MIVWHPFDPLSCSSESTVASAAGRHAEMGHYLLISFVPGAGWSGAYGIPDNQRRDKAVVATNLVTDRHVQIVALSVPGSEDAQVNGGNRA